VNKKNEIRQLFAELKNVFSEEKMCNILCACTLFKDAVIALSDLIMMIVEEFGPEHKLLAYRFAKLITGREELNDYIDEIGSDITSQNETGSSSEKRDSDDEFGLDMVDYDEKLNKDEDFYIQRGKRKVPDIASPILEKPAKMSRKKRKAVEDRLRASPKIWSSEEDMRLIAAIKKHGVGNWTIVAREVGDHRKGSECSQHWNRVLNPKIRKGKFTEEEEKILIDKVLQYGCDAWAQVAVALPGRTDIQCRYQWMCLQRRVQKGNIGLNIEEDNDQLKIEH